MPLSYYVDINQENIFKTLFYSCRFPPWSQFSFIKSFFSLFSFFFPLDIYPKCLQDNLYYRDYRDFTGTTIYILVNQSNFNLGRMKLYEDHSDLMHSMCKRDVDFNFL